jgi:hypothetical protein
MSHHLMDNTCACSFVFSFTTNAVLILSRRKIQEVISAYNVQLCVKATFDSEQESPLTEGVGGGTSSVTLVFRL